MRKLGNFLFYLFYTCVGLIAMFMSVASLALGDAGDSMLLGPICLGIMMIVVFKLTTHKDRKKLRIGSGKLPIWKPGNLLYSFLLFNFLMIGNFVYVLLAGSDIAGTAEEANKFTRTVAILILTAGSLCIWIMHCNVLFLGVGGYVRSLWRFIKNIVWIYLLYRLAIFLFTLLSSLIMLLINDEGDALLTHAYFLYILEDSLSDNLATGFLSQSGNFMSGITSASSYFVLSSLALESLLETEEVSIKERIKRMFFDKDTFRLLIMTLLCILVPLISNGNQEQLALRLMFYVLVISWLLSVFSFLKETQVIPYLFNYLTLTFLETMVPVPEMSSFGSFFLAVVAIIVRILLFSSVAMMIAYLQHPKLTDQTSSTEDSSNGATILNTGLAIAGLYMNRKKILKDHFHSAIGKE